MKDQITKWILDRFEKAIVWSFDETRDYVYVRFTTNHELKMLTYFKANGASEIFNISEVGKIDD